MSEQIQGIQFIIKNNVLLLAQISQKSQDGQRNILNKWFQDSVKNYIFEQIAFPLIGKQLKCYTAGELKEFIHKNIGKSKPKYMSIMDQYFLYISKFNQNDIFIKKLNSIIQNSDDISKLELPLSFKIQKTVRKQFVCYLVMRFFESSDHGEIPSFYELWNICFPEEIQTKKKLSRFDKKNQNKKQAIFKEESSLNNGGFMNSSTSLCANSQNDNLHIESSLDDPQSFASSIYLMNSFDQASIEAISNENCFRSSQKSIICSQKKQINNGIISDDEEEDEKYSTNYSQIGIQNQQFNQTEESYHSQSEKQQREQDQYLHQYEYQNQLYKETQNFQNFDLHYNQQIQKLTNYFPNYYYQY